VNVVFALIAAQPKEVLDAGSAAADTLTRTALGSLVVLLLIFCGLLGYLVVRAKNAHLSDKDTMRGELLAQALRSQQLAQETNKSNDALVRATEAQTEHVGRLTDSVDKMRESLSDVNNATRNSCRGADRASTKIDALAMSMPGVDRDKYWTGSKRGGGGGDAT